MKNRAYLLESLSKWRAKEAVAAEEVKTDPSHTMPLAIIRGKNKR